MTDKTSSRWTFWSCPICQVPIDLEKVSPTFPDRDGTPIDFTCCQECHTLFPAGANGADDDDAETRRQADYHEQMWEDTNFERLDLLAATAMPLAWEFAEFLEPADQSGAVIDIGAGRGNILHSVRRLGYPVGGCEPSTGLSAIARSAYLLGPDILHNTDADEYLHGLASNHRLASDPPPISGFIIWHVLEHLREPIPLLRKCLTIAPEARFFIELPLAITDDVFPEHLFFPTPRTLRWLADSLGLDIDLLQMTEDDRLRVFYRHRARGAEPSASHRAIVDTIDDLEQTYREVSPGFAFFSSGVAADAALIR